MHTAETVKSWALLIHGAQRYWVNVATLEPLEKGAYFHDVYDAIIMLEPSVGRGKHGAQVDQLKTVRMATPLCGFTSKLPLSITGSYSLILLRDASDEERTQIAHAFNAADELRERLAKGTKLVVS